MTVYVINSNGDKFKVTEWTAQDQHIINSDHYKIESVTKDEMVLKYVPQPYVEESYWGQHHMV